VPCPVMMEPGEVRQVVMNLVTNAWEAIGNEEGTVGIAVRSVSGPGLFEGFNPTGEMPGQGPWICLEVRDTGSGMDQKTLERLFDPFFSTKFTGRGLGMAVTLGIVEACDGAIFVKSAPERGTTVRVFFPKQ
jgi:two-component system, cell cycle sensor histidine kinase and response regulator CckA